MKTRKLAMAALFAALIMVFSQIQIPLPMVPLNLATAAIYIAAGLLPFPWGGISVLVYLLCGLVGLPVFAGLQGGAGALLGPTGGFLAGYLPLALLANIKAPKTIQTKKADILRFSLLCVLGTFILYMMGTLWFVHLTGTPVSAALYTCVYPFIPGDALKIFFASLLKARLQRALKV